MVGVVIGSLYANNGSIPHGNLQLHQIRIQHHIVLYGRVIHGDNAVVRAVIAHMHAAKAFRGQKGQPLIDAFAAREHRLRHIVFRQHIEHMPALLGDAGAQRITACHEGEFPALHRNRRFPRVLEIADLPRRALGKCAQILARLFPCHGVAGQSGKHVGFPALGKRTVIEQRRIIHGRLRGGAHFFARCRKILRRKHFFAIQIACKQVIHLEGHLAHRVRKGAELRPIVAGDGAAHSDAVGECARVIAHLVHEPHGAGNRLLPKGQQGQIALYALRLLGNFPQ